MNAGTRLAYDLLNTLKINRRRSSWIWTALKAQDTK